VAPAIVPGVPWTAAPSPLGSSEIKWAIGALLTEGVVPDNSLSADSVNRKWEKLTRAPEELKPKKAALTWPIERRAAEKGRTIRKNNMGNMRGGGGLNTGPWGQNSVIFNSSGEKYRQTCRPIMADRKYAAQPHRVVRQEFFTVDCRLSTVMDGQPTCSAYFLQNPSWGGRSL
jgi:hypothetical protein